MQLMEYLPCVRYSSVKFENFKIDSAQIPHNFKHSLNLQTFLFKNETPPPQKVDFSRLNHSLNPA